MSDRTLTATPVQAHPLPDRFQAFYGHMSGFDPLDRSAFLDVKVSAAKDGYVLLSVALPEGLSRSFVAFLDAMHGLMRCADQQAVRAVREARPVDLQQVEVTAQQAAAFRDKICMRFDELDRAGVPVDTRVKWINAELKGEGHPWAGHHVVREILSAAGCFRRNYSGFVGEQGKAASPSPPKDGSLGRQGQSAAGRPERPGDPAATARRGRERTARR